MKNAKFLFGLILVSILGFGFLDSNSSLNEETKTIAKELNTRVATTNKMVSFISKMPALTGAIEFQSFNQLDVVIENIFNDDPSIKRFLVVDINGNIIHSKATQVGFRASIPEGLIQSDKDYFLINNSLFIKKTVNSELSNEKYLIAFEVDFFSMLNEKIQSLGLPPLPSLNANYQSRTTDFSSIILNDQKIHNSYLKIYFKKNIFRFMAIFLVLVFFSMLLVRLLITPIKSIIILLQNISSDKNVPLTVDSYPRIFRPILKSIIEANLAIRNATTKQKETEILRERNEAVAKTAEKVAHDIRSPLTSLEFIVKNIGTNLQERERITANQALERISDILRTLSGKHSSEENTQAKVEIIDPLVKRIISEKRLEFKTKNNLEILLNNNIPYGTFVNISKAEFFRTMSNLINNSAEAALPDKKLLIEISLLKKDGDCIITVKDNGKGIPPEALSKVFQHGVSIGKASGSGIGLTSAKETIEKYKGSLSLNSEEGKGTLITIKLPIVPPPRWFKTTLKFATKNVCIIDDDDSIHSIWDEILSDKSLSVVHLKSSSEFENWFKNINRNDFSFLFDLELLGSQLNGLELIEKFNLESRSTLVTSHYDDTSVQDKAKKLGIKIIPKDSAASISIEIAPVSSRELVLIDDDNLVHMNWEMAADKKQVNLSTYYSVSEFLKNADKFSKDTAIYIDSNLKDGIKGEIESKKIFDLGFENLILASGMEFEQLPYWIKGNQGKTFPLQ